MKKLNRKIALAVVLTLCITLLAGTITARANIDGDIGVCWWKMNRAHDGAEAARALGCTDEYVLKWFGDRWTEANNERKELEAQKQVNIGTFRISHYCPCEICNGAYTEKPTALGTTLTPYRTIAVDPRVIPLGSHVIINGQEYIAEDTGGAIKGQRIDLCVATHSEATAKGVIYTDVYLVK